MKTKCALSLAAILTFSVSAVPALAQHDHAHEDLVVGHTGAGQLMIEFADFGEAHALAAVSGALNGWLGDDPGFAHLEADEPDEDFYMLAAGAEIWFEVVSFDTALQAWGPGYTGPYSGAGDQVLLGDEELHEHLNWHINSDAAGFDLMNAPWQATFKLIDKGTTGYAASPSYTLSFVPEPGTLGLFGIASLALLFRRRG